MLIFSANSNRQWIRLLFLNRALFLVHAYQIRVWLRAVPEIILGWVGRRHFLCPVRGWCFVDNVPEGLGGNLSWGSRSIWSIVGQRLIKALTCPEGREVLTPCVSWGWRSLKKIATYADRIISGTALIHNGVLYERIIIPIELQPRDVASLLGQCFFLPFLFEWPHQWVCGKLIGLVVNDFKILVLLDRPSVGLLTEPAAYSLVLGSDH